MPDRRSLIALISALPLADWGGLSLLYSNLPGLWATGTTGFTPASRAILLLVRTWRKTVGLFAVLFALVLVAFLLKAPSNQRDWQPDLALLPYAIFEGKLVTLHNVRSCDYRSETDFTVQHYDRTFDLDALTSLDLYLVDRGLKSVVHTLLSFGFNNRDYIAISIEARKEKGEGYSTLKGFFRQYEPAYVVAEERDVVRLPI